MLNSPNKISSVALVTGGANGIGFATALELMQQGHHVLVVDSIVDIYGKKSNKEQRNIILKKINDNKIEFLELDISIKRNVKHIISYIIKKYGRLDIIINNAAILRDSMIYNLKEKDYSQVIKTNLFGPFYIMNESANLLRNKEKIGPRKIINIVSTSGIFGNYGQAAYASSKAGLYALTRVCALELKKYGTTVNAVAPFACTRVTEYIDESRPEQKAYKEKALKIPASYPAKFISYLSSIYADNITGQIFGVRGKEIFLILKNLNQSCEKTILNKSNFLYIKNEIDSKLKRNFFKLETDISFYNDEPLV